jgi:hypothetical protein
MSLTTIAIWLIGIGAGGADLVASGSWLLAASMLTS